MKIQAKRKAFFKGAIIKVGEVIDITGNKCPDWAKKIGEDKPAPKQPEQQKNEPQQPETKTGDEQLKLGDGEQTPSGETIVAGDGGVFVDNGEQPEQTEQKDEFAGKTDAEILAELDTLITKGIEKNIMLEDVENKTPIQQIVELRELLKDAE